MLVDQVEEEEPIKAPEANALKGRYMDDIDTSTFKLEIEGLMSILYIIGKAKLGFSQSLE